MCLSVAVLAAAWLEAAPGVPHLALPASAHLAVVGPWVYHRMGQVAVAVVLLLVAVAVAVAVVALVVVSHP